MDDTKEEVANTIVTKLSEDLMIDILSRLPVKTILSFMCVCKTWLRLISDKDFATHHLSRSPPGILIKALPEGGISSIFHAFQIVQTGRTFKAERMEFVPGTNLPAATPNIELMNSCNGLLCLSGGEFRNVIHVCNPILCEHIKIHVDDHKACLYGQYFALGCSATGKQYKVLWTFNQNDRHRNPKAEIYTIGTGQWRSIGNSFSIERLDFDTSLHGCIHWARYETSLECICSFDFETEQFKRLPTPPLCDGNLDGFSRLGVLKDCLSLTVRKWDAPYEIVVWVMNEYGVQESWSKQFLFKPDNLHFISCEPLILLRTGKIFILLDEEFGDWYNVEKIMFRGRIIRCENVEDTRAIAYTPSFVSLHHIAEGEEQVLRTNSGLTEIPKSSMRGSEDPAEKGDWINHFSSSRGQVCFLKRSNTFLKFMRVIVMQTQFNQVKS
ncbi:hypothetical protein OIU84_024393 [Salix udensis]|uniref:F-box domain-containing protein n=1 Tax=Salix udensis TaxID=889485 RepID=A0AAD6PBI3_9ROSI|nr:hypothetical protein OIU84_024393 [Salix udensis]